MGLICSQAERARVTIQQAAATEAKKIESTPERERPRRLAEAVSRLADVYAVERATLPRVHCGGERCLAPAMRAGMSALLVAAAYAQAPRLSAPQAVAMMAFAPRTKSQRVLALPKGRKES